MQTQTYYIVCLFVFGFHTLALKFSFSEKTTKICDILLYFTSPDDKESYLWYDSGFLGLDWVVFEDPLNIWSASLFLSLCHQGTQWRWMVRRSGLLPHSLSFSIAMTPRLRYVKVNPNYQVKLSNLFFLNLWISWLLQKFHCTEGPCLMGLLILG